MSPRHVVMAAGGTAGHVAPALNTAHALVALDPSVEISVLGTGRELEQRLVAESGFPLIPIPAVAMPRSLNRAALAAPRQISQAVAAARSHIRATSADAVVGFGGYAAAPAYLAARSVGCPFFVHEANSRAGWANKLGARFTPYVGSVHATGLPHERHMGMPLSDRFSRTPDAQMRVEARAYFQIPQDATVVVAFGGSQGAAHINESIKELVALRPDLWVIHAHGAAHGAVSQSSHYLPYSYIDRMDLAYAAADVVIARAGAMTCAEVAVMGTPTVFVPLPHGNGEQEGNARPLVDAGGAMLVADSVLNGLVLDQSIRGIVSDTQHWQTMHDALVAHAEPHASTDMAQWILDVLAGLD